MSSGPFSAETDGKELDFETIREALGEPREELLIAFLETDREVLSTADLRDHTSVSRGSIIHHLDRLEQWGLVAEQDEREYHRGGGPTARTWTLTSRGRSFCDEVVSTPARVFVSPDDVAVLEQRVDSIETEIEEIKDAHNEMADFVEDLAQQLDSD